MMSLQSAAVGPIKAIRLTPASACDPFGAGPCLAGTTATQQYPNRPVANRSKLVRTGLQTPIVCHRIGQRPKETALNDFRPSYDFTPITVPGVTLDTVTGINNVRRNRRLLPV